MTDTVLTSGDFTEAAEPFRLFGAWLEDAAKSEPNDPNGLALATVDEDGMPDVRMVLLKGFDEEGFVFYTSNVSAPRTPVEMERLSDEATIRNAVTSADVETLAGAPLPWANAETGARGRISGIVETRGKGTLCRAFSATRESFDGVGMFKGQACMVASGAWRMQRFDAL